VRTPDEVFLVKLPMKIACAVAAVAVIGFSVSTRLASAPTPDLKSLFERQRWSDLREAGQVSRLPTFYRGVVDGVFNDASAEEHLLAALEPPSGQEWQRYEARTLLIELYARAGRYREALDHIDKIIAEMPNWQEAKDTRPLYAALARTPRQLVASNEFARIRWRMKEGLIFIPLEVNGRRVEFFVDTGAGFSMVTESQARGLGLAISDSAEGTISDSVGTRLSIRTAVADELKLGNTRIRHALFLVVGDETQPFASLPQGERGVIGFPVLVALQRIHWNKAGEFEIGFPSRPEKPDEPNLFFRGQRMHAELRFAEGRLAAFIDTGATHTRFLPRFATDYPQVVKSGARGSEKTTGGGGSVEVSTVELPDLRMWVRDVEISLSDLTLQLERSDPGLQHSHAVLGMDLMTQLAPITIDFDAMTFSMGR
jgi:hypothetical protein